MSVNMSYWKVHVFGSTLILKLSTCFYVGIFQLETKFAINTHYMRLFKNICYIFNEAEGVTQYYR